MLILLLSVSAFFINKVNHENSLLLKEQTNTLVKSHYNSLNVKDFREFAEGVSDLSVFSFISIKQNGLEFSLGDFDSTSYCYDKRVELRSDLTIVALKFCKKRTYDKNLFVVVAVIFLLLFNNNPFFRKKIRG